MSKFLYHLGSWSYRKVWPFLAFWLALLVAMGGLAGAFAKSPSPTFSMPDMDSTVTQEQMMERFGTETDAMSAPSATITLQAPEGKKLTDKAVMGEVDSMIKELQGTDALKDPDAIVNPVMASMGMQKQ
ncbi:MMPL family transporter, partial [Corynebacterium striatum]